MKKRTVACYELGNNTNLIAQAVKIHKTVNNKQTLLTILKPKKIEYAGKASHS